MLNRSTAGALVVLALMTGGCAFQLGATDVSAGEPPTDLAPVAPIAATPIPKPAIVEAVGVASWYGAPHHGRLTANGDVFDMNELTAAHRSLPFGTRVAVTNLTNGKSVVVIINDRGPFIDGRIIDVSRYAAKQLGFANAGLARVRMRTLYIPADA